MAKAVAIAATAVQFVDVGTRLLSSFIKLYGRLKDAPHVIQALSDEIKQLVDLANDLKTEGIIAASAADTAKAVLDDCVTLCHQLEDVLNKILVDTDDFIIRKAWKAVVAVKKEEQIRDICSRLERKKSALNLWISGNSHSRLASMEETLDSIQRALPTIFQQLSSITPALELELGQIVPGTVASLQSHFQRTDSRFDELLAVGCSTLQMEARLVSMPSMNFLE